MAAADTGIRKQKTQDDLIPGAFRWFLFDVTIKAQVWSDIDNPLRACKIVLDYAHKGNEVMSDGWKHRKRENEGDEEHGYSMKD
jgi:hypothetical protein